MACLHLILVAALAGAAGAACAQAPLTLSGLARPAEPLFARAALQSRPLDLALRSRNPRDAQAQALRAAGLARTSIDRRFASDDLTGSLGFLCGLEPGFNRNGVTGSDPHGRFLGAKLSLGF